LTVATVQAAPSTTARIVSPPGPGSLLFCVLTTATTVNVLVEVTERFAQAFLSQTDETGLGPDGLGGTPAKFKLRYTLSGIPVGARVTPTVVLGLPSTSTTLTFVAMDPLTYLSASGAQDNDFDLEITKTDTTVIELVTVNFAIQVPDVSDSAFPKVEASANLRILLRGATDSPEAPRFSTAAASRQLDATAFRSLACASYLLFPWVANTGDGAVDTGLAIANTTADPPQIGSLPQKGDVTLHFWRSAGGTNPAPLKIATALEAGRTATYVISALGAPFQGYVIAVCTFQMGHGIAAFLSGGSFNAFTAISLLNPRVLGGATEQVGH
jgi:hypothetical protein